MTTLLRHKLPNGGDVRIRSMEVHGGLRYEATATGGVLESLAEAEEMADALGIAIELVRRRRAAPRPERQSASAELVKRMGTAG